MTTSSKTGKTSRATRTRSGTRTSPNQADMMADPRRHLLDLDDLDALEIEGLLNSAEGMLEIAGRDVRKTPALRGKTIITLFYENSTRTRVSFEQAGKILGADVINVAASTSSVSKGESLLNTVKTLEAMQIDALVVRHPHSGAPYFIANHTDASVVNAGDGTHAHPTQSLLDLFTVRKGSLSSATSSTAGWRAPTSSPSRRWERRWLFHARTHCCQMSGNRVRFWASKPDSKIWKSREMWMRPSRGRMS